MSTVILFLLALGLAMDCFAIAISNSSISGPVKPGIPLKVAIAFAFAHMVMLFFGFQLGGLIRSLFEGNEPFVALFILLFIGSKMIMDARKRKPQSRVFDINEARVIITLSVAGSMDAFLAGVAGGIKELSLFHAGALITLTVFIFSLAGMSGGQNFGLNYAKNIGLIGGILIILAGIGMFLG